jgi:hypothetical protein
LIGDRGYIYHGPEQLQHILTNFVKQPEKDWNVYKDYNPERIMRIFDEVFLK